MSSVFTGTLFIAEKIILLINHPIEKDDKANFSRLINTTKS
jgi:hypothetical protein